MSRRVCYHSAPSLTLFYPHWPQTWSSDMTPWGRWSFPLTWIIGIAATLGPWCYIFPLPGVPYTRICLLFYFLWVLLQNHLLLEAVSEHSLKYPLTSRRQCILYPPLHFIFLHSINIFHHLMHFILYWVSCSLKYKCCEGRNILFSIVLYPQCLEKCLKYVRYSINIWWISQLSDLGGRL